MTVGLDQRRTALTKANRVRFARASFRELMAGIDDPQEARREAARVIVHHHGIVASVPVHSFLSCVPGEGPKRIRRLLRGLDVWPLDPVGSLSGRQREEIGVWLLRSNGWADRYRGVLARRAA